MVQVSEARAMRHAGGVHQIKQVVVIQGVVRRKRAVHREGRSERVTIVFRGSDVLVQDVDKVALSGIREERLHGGGLARNRVYVDGMMLRGDHSRDVVGIADILGEIAR